MFGFWDSEEDTNLDNKGEINNNVIASEPIEVHDNVYILILIICIVKLIELANTIYASYTRHLKKRYQAENNARVNEL